MSSGSTFLIYHPNVCVDVLSASSFDNMYSEGGGLVDQTVSIQYCASEERAMQWAVQRMASSVLNLPPCRRCLDSRACVNAPPKGKKRPRRCGLDSFIQKNVEKTPEGMYVFRGGITVSLLSEWCDLLRGHYGNEVVVDLVPRVHPMVKETIALTPTRKRQREA